MTEEQLEATFDAQGGLLPAVASDADDGRLLMLAWVSPEALRLTLETGEAHYYSRSRKKIWRKGETSGNVQKVAEVRIDCDLDAIWMRVRPAGAACHTGRRGCFYRRIESIDSDGRMRLSFVDAEK